MQVTTNENAPASRNAAEPALVRRREDQVRGGGYGDPPRFGVSGYHTTGDLWSPAQRARGAGS